MPLRFIASVRGAPLLVIEGFAFRKDRAAGSRTSWRCITEGCRARVFTNGDEHEEVPEHTHAPDPLKLAVRVKLNKMKKAAKRAPKELPSSVVVSDMVLGVRTEAVRGRLPNLRLLRRQADYIRKRGANREKEASKRQDLQVSDSLKITAKGEPFLYFDSGPGDPERIIVFATQGNLKLLQECPEWLMDGTFRVCPRSFHQIYSVHVRLCDGNTVPVLFALLPGKSAGIYRKLLGVISKAIDGFEPDGVHVDFELSMMSEVEKAFPASGILGCAFHFNQSIWRHVQADGALRDKYVKSLDFALKLRMFCALAYVPEAEVRGAFEALLKSAFVAANEELLRSFINYFETTWIGRDRQPSLIKIQWWNLHTAVLNGMSRTTNEVEGWHANFAGRLGLVHPSFAKLVEALKVEQGRTEFVVSNTGAQGRGTRQKRVYRDRSMRLEELVRSYPRRNLMGFLMSCAHNISF